MKNVYDGVVITDASGLATVTMPAWFEARSIAISATNSPAALGQPAQTWIAKKIANGRFTIQTDKPGVEVSWQITGIRQDAWANAHRIPVEEEEDRRREGALSPPRTLWEARRTEHRHGACGESRQRRGGAQAAGRCRCCCAKINHGWQAARLPGSGTATT